MQPPQNPYGSPNPYNQPYPPPGSPPYQQPPGYPPGGATSPQGPVSVDVISEAWRYLQPNIGLWMVGSLIMLLPLMVADGVAQLLQAPFAPRPGGPELKPIFFVAVFVGQVLTSTGYSIGLASGIKMALSHIRTGRPDIGEMFKIGDVIGPILVASLLMGLGVGCGIWLCIVPGVVLSLGWSMTPLLIIERKMAPIDAMKLSWDTMKPHLGSFFVVLLLLGLLNGVGLCALCIGLLVTAALTPLSYALVYRNLFGLDSAGPRPQGPPGYGYNAAASEPPIPNPGGSYPGYPPDPGYPPNPGSGYPPPNPNYPPNPGYPPNPNYPPNPGGSGYPPPPGNPPSLDKPG